ncbi:Vitamin K epoxide reductase complex subunit 1 [Fasciola hepatica]|uniref:vitamin-K-epoxide reductase (warfarin-sensitive) n=1 Tax=Fasciola hepatica TaxID=6192 RepID=A0A2H1BVZ3_FASHE|nr:Vitamin K epoxide reductase complex subunit 1 [Fasciola hepatica]
MNYTSLTSCTGILVCIYALYVEYSKENDKDYKPVCDISDKISCTKVLLSEYSRGFGLLPRTWKNSWLNQRNPVFGLIFYSLLLVLDHYGTFGALKLSLVLAILSCIGSVYLAYLLYFVLKSLCLVCLAIYVINAVLLINYSWKYYNFPSSEFKTTKLN